MRQLPYRGLQVSTVPTRSRSIYDWSVVQLANVLCALHLFAEHVATVSYVSFHPLYPAAFTHFRHNVGTRAFHDPNHGGKRGDCPRTEVDQRS